MPPGPFEPFQSSRDRTDELREAFGAKPAEAAQDRAAKLREMFSPAGRCRHQRRPRRHRKSVATGMDLISKGDQALITGTYASVRLPT